VLALVERWSKVGEPNVDQLMIVAEAVGRHACRPSARTWCSGSFGSGNFHVNQCLIADGARFVAARQRVGRRAMRSAYARAGETVSELLSVHQGLAG